MFFKMYFYYYFVNLTRHKGSLRNPTSTAGLSAVWMTHEGSLCLRQNHNSKWNAPPCWKLAITENIYTGFLKVTSLTFERRCEMRGFEEKSPNTSPTWGWVLTPNPRSDEQGSCMQPHFIHNYMFSDAQQGIGVEGVILCCCVKTTIGYPAGWNRRIKTPFTRFTQDTSSHMKGRKRNYIMLSLLPDWTIISKIK